MKPVIIKTLVAIFALLLALVISEGALRLLKIGYPDFYDYDPLLGSRLRPGIEGYFLKEGGGYVSINADGLRDREHSLEPAPHTLRIAVLGDSFAEAMQVNQDETFWAIMEKNLQGCANLGGRRVEVLNFGQAGLGTAQELLAFRHRAAKYAPDVVLLAFFTGNDMADNSPALMQYDYNPYFTLEDGRLVLHDRRTREKWAEEQQKKSWGGEMKRWCQDHFRVFQVWGQFQKVLKARWSQFRRGEAHAAPFGSEAGLKTDVYRAPTKKVWQDAWQVTEALLVQLRDEVAARGARLYVVVMTIGAQVLPDAANREGFARELGLQDLLYADRRLEAFCRQQGIPVLLLAPPFQEYASAHQVFLHGFKDTLGIGHWNRQGHRLAGDLIAKWLCGQLH